MFGEFTVSSRSSWVCRWKARELGGAATKFAVRGRRGSRTSTMVKPSLNMWLIKAWPWWTITCTPSPRPPWPQCPTNSMLRADTGIMPRSSTGRALFEVLDVVGARLPIGVARPFSGPAGHFVAITHPEQQGALRTVDVFVQFTPRMDDEGSRQ